VTPTVPLPPATLARPNIRTVGAGTILHRTHAGAFRAAQFNPGMGQPTRFAPIDDNHGKCVPSLYAATSREAAAFESIFHDIEPTAMFKTVTLNALESRSVSTITPKRDLRLASLFAPDLKAWGVARIDLIETPKSTYAQTALWAKAIHAAFSDIDGLIWTSRQCDPDQCVILFGDRVGEPDFGVVDCLPVKGDAALLMQLRGFGARAGITITA
jgi:hypothetical protein